MDDPKGGAEAGQENAASRSGCEVAPNPVAFF